MTPAIQYVLLKAHWLLAVLPAHQPIELDCDVMMRFPSPTGDELTPHTATSMSSGRRIEDVWKQVTVV